MPAIGVRGWNSILIATQLVAQPMAAPTVGIITHGTQSMRIPPRRGGSHAGPAVVVNRPAVRGSRWNGAGGGGFGTQVVQPGAHPPFTAGLPEQPGGIAQEL